MPTWEEARRARDGEPLTCPRCQQSIERPRLFGHVQSHGIMLRVAPGWSVRVTQAGLEQLFRVIEDDPKGAA